MSGGSVLAEEGGVHIRCALTSALARETSGATISVRSQQTAGVLRCTSPGSARPHSHPSICFKRFHIGAVFGTSSLHPGYQRSWLTNWFYTNTHRSLKNDVCRPVLVLPVKWNVFLPANSDLTKNKATWLRVFLVFVIGICDITKCFLFVFLELISD